MVFSSMVFLGLFLPSVFIIYQFLRLVDTNILKRKQGSPLVLENIWLLVASLVFYAWGEPHFIWIMLGSILINYVCGLVIAQFSKTWLRRAILVVCLVLNLGILSYFKYLSTTFALLEAVTSIEIGSIVNTVLPIGISFYTFQALSYVIDVYRGVCAPQKNPLLLALYIALFPQLVAGPIVKYKEISSQLVSRTPRADRILDGIERFIYGLFKKVFIANQLAVVVDQIFALQTSDLSTALAWAGAIMYTMQIYFDFSGYSDMAIGLGLMFGFTFPENFNLPYLSRSVKEFWRRWHISLSTWFKDYLYIPLGGNRKGTARTYLNLLIVFLATGIWHGAGLSFIVWGLYHGFFIVIERMGFGRILHSDKCKYLSHIYLLLVVVIGWVFFRSESLTQAFAYLQAMFTLCDSATYGFFELVSFQSCFAFLLGVVLCGPVQSLLAKVTKKDAKDFLVERTQEDQGSVVERTREEQLNDAKKAQKGQLSVVGEAGSKSMQPRPGRTVYRIVQFALLLFLLFVCLTYIAAGAYNPFIYFRF